jgi:hypothetical protein
MNQSCAWVCSLCSAGEALHKRRAAGLIKFEHRSAVRERSSAGNATQRRSAWRQPAPRKGYVGAVESARRTQDPTVVDRIASVRTAGKRMMYRERLTLRESANRRDAENDCSWEDENAACRGRCRWSLHRHISFRNTVESKRNPACGDCEFWEYLPRLTTGTMQNFTQI